MHFVFVHGICHGGWCWDETRTDLEKLGHTVSTLDLPLTSLDDDANAVVEVLNSLNEPCVLAGHSYGGLVISKAADKRTDVQHLVYVAAVLIEKDEVLAETAEQYPTILTDYMVAETDTHFSITNEGALKTLYNCCDPDTAASAAKRLRPTAFECLAGSPGAEPWQSIPSTYILCEQDMAIAPKLQEVMAARATNTIVLDTDHSPFYSSREEMQSILAGVC